MLRANLIAPTRIVLEEASEPTPGPGEVRLRIETCGVCGSDIHAYYGEHPFIDLPVQPGHEFVGEIDALGPGVAGWSVGQRVTAEPSLVCGECAQCRAGRYNICERLRVIGCQSDGALAEYLVVPAAKLVEIPDGMTNEQGAMIEPLAVGVHAMRLAALTPATRLLILGAGAIGLTALMAARAQGVTDITITDTVPAKLDLARELGAKHAVNVGVTDLADFCRATFDAERAFDVAAECVGVEATVRDAINTLKKGGALVIVGVFGHEVKVNLGLVQDRELRLIGSLMYTMDDFLTARDLIASGRAPVTKLITGRYPLGQIGAAMQFIDQQRAHNIKTMIHIRPQ
ncbi:MAG: alcohol dehydrogenase catalytic domain-containing protein [Anaerolineae bacterium]